MHTKFPSIRGFHNIWKESVAYFSKANARPPVVNYRGKVKLHGTNAAIRLDFAGISAQKRNEDCTPASNDGHYGFREFVELTKDYWEEIRRRHIGVTVDEVLVFGEWAGPGIQKGVAISQIEQKAFFVFAVKLLLRGSGVRWVVEPNEITQWVPPQLKGSAKAGCVFIMPWSSMPITIDFNDRNAGAEIADQLNARVALVDSVDPYVLGVFGVTGVGEGEVYYPRTRNGVHLNHLDDGDMNMLFKVKGASHAEKGAAKPARLKPGPSADALAFADEHVTEARLMQGMREVFGEEPPTAKGMGRFLGWIGKDVEKETVDEREASGLDWKTQLAAPVMVRARTWLFDKMKVTE